MKKLLLIAGIVVIACGSNPDQSSASEPKYNLRYMGHASVQTHDIYVYCDPKVHVIIYDGANTRTYAGDSLTSVQLTPDERDVC